MGALCQLFLRVAGPATVVQMATWIGVSQRTVKSALASLPVVPVTVEGTVKPAHVVLADDLPALTEGPAAPEHFAFLPFEDLLITAHGGPGLYVAERFREYPVDSWGRVATDDPSGVPVTSASGRCFTAIG